MSEKTKIKVNELVALSENLISDAKKIMLDFDKYGLLGISDKQFVEINNHLKDLAPSEREAVLDVFADMILKRLQVAGFEKAEIDKIGYIRDSQLVNMLKTRIDSGIIVNLYHMETFRNLSRDIHISYG